MKAPVDLIAIARDLGFARAAVVPIEPPRRHHLYESWLADGKAGEMHYLAAPAHVAQRGDLRTILDSARSLIVVALAYDRGTGVPGDRRGTGVPGDRRGTGVPGDRRGTGVPGDRRGTGVPGDTRGTKGDVVPADRLRGKIARYARGEDYHLVMRDKLVLLADRLAAELGTAIASRPCVDSAPVLEREWAERGGLGFVAKNTMLIAPGLGSYVLLGELLIDRELDVTAPEEVPKPRCGSCRACLDACPTQAFTDAYVLDARRCISYLTIEHHGTIPVELRAAIGTWVFGCDVCQEVCPFNDGKSGAPDPLLVARSIEHASPDLIALARMGTNQMRQLVRRTALRRVPREVLQRNVAIALGNTGDADAVPVLGELLASRFAIVRAHAAWALGELMARGTREFMPAVRALLDAALERETDAEVRAELMAAASRTPD